MGRPVIACESLCCALPISGRRRKPLSADIAVTRSDAPGLVPTRRLYVSPLDGVCASVAAFHENVTVPPATAALRPVGAVGGVLLTAVLFRHRTVIGAIGSPLFGSFVLAPATRRSKRPSLSESPHAKAP